MAEGEIADCWQLNRTTEESDYSYRGQYGDVGVADVHSKADNRGVMP